MTGPGLTPGEVVAALIADAAHRGVPHTFVVGVDAAGNEWRQGGAWTPNIGGAWWTATSEGDLT